MKARSVFLLSLFSATSLPLMLAAQDAATPSTDLEDIVVTDDAAARSAPAGTGPVTTVTASDIARTQAGTLNDALRFAPSVVTAGRGNILRSLPNIRGFGGTTHMASDPASQVAVDGVSTEGSRLYQNATDMLIDPALLKSVSVLTGPLASLEYGSGIAGGTVAMETVNGADLTHDAPGVKFRQLLGANSNGRGWVTSSTLAWQPGQRVDFLFNITRRAQDEQKDGSGALTRSAGFNVPSYLAKARFRLDDANSITLSYTRSSGAERDVPYGQATAAAVFGNVNRDRTGTVASAAWNFNPAGNDLIDTELKFSRSEQTIDITAVTPGSFADRLWSGTYQLDTDRVTLKNTARFTTGSVSHSLRAGLDWSQQSKTLLAAPVTNTSPSGKLSRLGLFAIDDMDFGHDLRASVGGRIERQKISGANATTAYGPFETTARTAGAGIEKGFGGGFTGFGSFTYGEGFATLDVFQYTSPTRGGAFYGEGVQQNRNWELGVKYRGDSVFAAGDRLSGSVSLYHTDIRNALFGPSSGGASEYTGYKMRGIEAQARYDLASGIYAQGVLTFADHKEQFHFAATGTVWRDFLYNPGQQARLTVGKRWASGWEVSWSLHAAKRQTIASGTTATHPGWGVNDLRVSYAPQSGVLAGATIDFGVENIFDKTYRPTISSLNEPGRNFKLTIAKTF